MLKNKSNDYVIQVDASARDLNAPAWNALLAQQRHATPFMRHEYLAALQQSGAATPATGWTPRYFSLFRDQHLVAASVVYLKAHSYGEYVFDWAWANAYQQHGLAYYPKAVVAPPFTPVPGTRLLALDDDARDALLAALLDWCRAEGLSSLHLLFAADEDLVACERAGLLLRHTVQFHWTNVSPTLVASGTTLPHEEEHFAPSFSSFDDFLSSLSQEKRKKIRQERRKVAEAGVTFRHARGANIQTADWDFFYRCYERTYLEHGNAPYLSRDFFQHMADHMAEHWLLFIAEQGGSPIASSLIALDGNVAYGRYWGALARVDCLHFEACYYQPLQWCITHGVARFEGGAQGEHKMARALLPVKTSSAHWLAHPAFADAVERFLSREGQEVTSYLAHLEQRNPFKEPAAAPK